MKIVLRFDKTAQQNASEHFEKAKKAKKKLQGLQKAMTALSQKIEDAGSTLSEKKVFVSKKKEKKWFEKFRWFFSSDNFLVLAGRDAKSNEALLKKHFEKEDLFFHADISGAAHVIAKAEGEKIPQNTQKEAAAFAAVFSRTWKEKLASIDVYSAGFGQVTKQAPSGESIGTGAFMVYGKREWFKKTPLEFAVGSSKDGKIICGPKISVKAHATAFVEVAQGDEKTSSAAKKIKKLLEEKTHETIQLDEIVSVLPSGGVKVKNGTIK